MFAQHDNMALGIEELKTIAKNLRKDGLNSQQIADELSLSQDTIQWLLTDSTSERPPDVRVGWRTIGVRPARITAIGALSNKYGQVGGGKKVAIIDDVLSSGVTMSNTIAAMRAAGGEVVLALVLVNKTVRNEIDDVPLRGLIRAVPV